MSAFPHLNAGVRALFFFEKERLTPLLRCPPGRTAGRSEHRRTGRPGGWPPETHRLVLLRPHPLPTCPAPNRHPERRFEAEQRNFHREHRRWRKGTELDCQRLLQDLVEEVLLL